MNKTKIDWADMTWNPVTGCLHGCEYCYARKITNRFGNKYFPYGEQINELDEPLDGEKGKDPYPFGFLPTLHRYRLDEPAKIKKPQTIFVCSMADLFGDWVPDEWIQEVFKACEAAPQHRYLFLTKNPQRYEQIYLPVMTNDWWYGASATNQKSLDGIENAFGKLSVMVKTFISIEPIQEKALFWHPDYYSWVIVGAETGSRKGKVIPKKEWIDVIGNMGHMLNIPVFMKESLRSLMGDDFKQEFPWEVYR